MSMTPPVVTFPSCERIGPCVVALGVFDGVHLGHRHLLEQARAEAMTHDAITVALTFDRDPDEVLRPDSGVVRLLEPEERFSRLHACGADVVVVIEFRAETAAMSPESFLHSVLERCCDPIAVHVGHGFRFGSSGSGDVHALQEWGSERGVHIREHPLLRIGGDIVSSTRIRALITSGAVEQATEFLASPHRITGTVVEGRKRGAVLGFPTANVRPPGHMAVPADGVYAGRVIIPDESVWPAAIFVGAPPSFPDAERLIEAHLIGFSGSLYGTSVTVEFRSRLRDLTVFRSPADLTQAIQDDVARALEYLTSPDPTPSDPPPGRMDTVDH